MTSITLPRHREDRSPAFNSLNILIAAKQACALHNIPPSMFGRRAAGDPRLLTHLEHGRTLGRECSGRVRAYIESLGSPISRSIAPEAKRARAEADWSPITTAAADLIFRAKMARGSRMLLKAIG
ncbi:hypothetical protein [Novosphingobium sp. JCM 18896]|uniref:hypothetical protein n=1 Tax=Novosphingobium sp. JCM 18896 TaxID=2989731 RepID=UPI002222EAAB|nr:hypothetical protein [Novosphingobium sp. JCM 18896]MCW1429927.1 hypothetical protein [Novosphingobium sp. JCM 18896]